MSRQVSRYSRNTNAKAEKKEGLDCTSGEATGCKGKGSQHINDVPFHALFTLATIFVLKKILGL